MLSDFGIDKLFEADQTTTLTGVGTAIGTPEYMAPEQWNGITSPLSDQYSLGIVLYEMVTGRKPYMADTPAAILLNQTTEPLPSPRKFVTDLPKTLELVLIKALAKNPDDRYQTAEEFAHAIQRGIPDHPLHGSSLVTQKVNFNKEDQQQSETVTRNKAESEIKEKNNLKKINRTKSLRLSPSRPASA